MKKKYFFFLLFFLSVPLFILSQKKAKDLPPLYRKWLEEEVVYIITPKEKEVFLQLETDRERDIFIEAFWRQRDPNPSTPENEFKEEHYRRITYANQNFGRGAPGPGWRTAMGRIYITLGEPKSIDRFENLTETYPIIIWFYEGMAEYGLPNAFYVVFFKKSGAGDYELYSPIRDGPQELLIHYKGDMTNYSLAYDELFQIEPTIAEVSLSLIPGEPQTLSPSLASEVLLFSKIPSAPLEKVKDTYAEKLLKYKDIVEVEYTANYMDNDSYIRVIQDKSGIFFVNYLVEPKRLSIEQFERRFYTKLEINGKISDPGGKTIYQYDKSIPIEFTGEQMENIKSKLFSFQDVFPLVEGSYRFNFLLKNTISKEFTSFESDIIIPKISGPQMSSLILANRVNKQSKYKGRTKPFFVRDIQLVPSPRNDFAPKDNLYLFFQIYGLTDELRENSSLEYAIYKGEEKVFSSIKSIKEYPDFPDFFEEISLANLSPANYKMKVCLLDKEKKEVLFEQSDFFITPVGYLPRPWVLSFPLPSSDDPLFSNILGNQLFNKKDFQGARRHLEKAYQKDPTFVKYALDYCRLLLATKEYQRVKEIALPFLKNQEKYEFLSLLGRSCQALGELEEAISYYKEYLSHFGTNIPILNSIGECYYKLGRKEEALVAWEKSLEINPKQEDIKKIVESLKGKK
ncbi:MAG: GWxTD domain-containing protein [Acidobacteriota bacterium]